MSNPRILIADDDRDLLLFLSAQLRAAGYEVACAQDSYQALERARREQPALMLLDVNMPAGDGFSVQARMKRMTDLAHIPTIYLTGEQSRRVAIGADQYASPVVRKPIELKELLIAIRTALGQSSDDSAVTSNAQHTPTAG